MYQNPSSHNAHVADAPQDVEAMLSDVSMRMARAQLQRQISNSSSTHRQRTSRIMKPSSAGSSPQHMQRRRAMTGHRISRYRSEVYPQGLYITQEGVEGFNGRQSMPSHVARPVSWHPSSISTSYQRPGSMYDTPFRHSLAYQTIDVNGMPTPMTQPESNSEIPADAWFNLDSGMNMYQPSTMYNKYDHTGLQLDTSIQNDYSVDQGTQYSLSAFPTSEGFPAFCADYSTRAWTESLSDFPAYTAPPTPDLLPIQTPTNNWRNDTVAIPALPRKDSKELIGMGLYDKPERGSFSLGSFAESQTNLFMPGRHDSIGKGLKLEETWEPPEEDEEDDDDDDDESEAEGQDETAEESHDKTIMNAEKTTAVVVTNEVQPGAVSHGHVNMSEQSFFFDHEDGYGDNMAVEQSMLHTAPLLRGASWNSYRW